MKYQPGSEKDVQQKEKLKSLKPFNGKKVSASVGTGPITPKVNARKIESNAKKIEKLMAMMKGGKATTLIGKKEHLNASAAQPRPSVVQSESSKSKSGKIVPY